MVETKIATPMQYHNAMEPHAVVAEWDGDRLMLDMPNQALAMSCASYAAYFGIPAANVTIRSPFLGGGFGSKAIINGPQILAIMAEPAWLSQGEAIYQGTCALCHSADGSGLVGPNLTDDKYKNITGLVSIADLITTGTTNGAMPSQKNILNENEIALVAAYAASLRGRDLPTNPTVSPDYEGVPIDPWPTPGGAE